MWGGGNGAKKQTEITNAHEITHGGHDEPGLERTVSANQSLATHLSNRPAATAGEEEDDTNHDDDGVHELVVGVDPSLLDDDRKEPCAGQEMQERSNMRMLSSRKTGESDPVDSMDMDQVMEDDSIREESAAVKNVFTE